MLLKSILSAEVMCVIKGKTCNLASVKTAIVILNWNGRQLLEQFLPSIIEHSSDDATIYVADNASTDDSMAYVKSHFPSVHSIENKTNGGYAKGYNDALKNIDADIYCLINSDVAVTKDWLSPILRIFKDDIKTAIIQPKILYFKDKTKFEYAGAAGGYIDALGYPYCRGRIFNHLETDYNQFNDIADIFWASGACFFIRRTVFNELQGFDEDYFAHQEEIDLCWRAKNKEYKVKYVGTSTVYHVGGATLQQTNPHKTYLNFRNSLLTILKNIPTKTLGLVILFRLVLDGVAGVVFLVERKPKHTVAILKAHLSFYRNIPKFIKKRKKLQQKGTYYRHLSIVWMYFIRGKTKFKDL